MREMLPIAEAPFLPKQVPDESNIQAADVIEPPEDGGLDDALASDEVTIRLALQQPSFRGCDILIPPCLGVHHVIAIHDERAAYYSFLARRKGFEVIRRNGGQGRRHISEWVCGLDKDPPPTNQMPRAAIMSSDRCPPMQLRRSALGQNGMSATSTRQKAPVIFPASWRIGALSAEYAFSSA